VQEEATVLQPQWDALSQVGYVPFLLCWSDIDVHPPIRHSHLFEGSMGAMPSPLLNQHCLVKYLPKLMLQSAGEDFHVDPNDTFLLTDVNVFQL
jgi:hypothetical protein